MHPEVAAAFGRLCLAHAPGHLRSVLEIGAMASADTLLNLPQLAGVPERVGISLSDAADYQGCKILQGNANHMPFLADGHFDLVLCNSTLEHDPKFWLSLQEIRRVLRPGGVAMLGVPGYAVRRGRGVGFLSRLKAFWPGFMPGARALASHCASTPTLLIHHYPGDYYRFSEQAVREVFLDVVEPLAVEILMTPPRIIGVGRKPV